MPRKLPPHVEPNRVKGKRYLYFRVGKGPRTRLPDDMTSQEFRDAYAAALTGDLQQRPAPRKDDAGTIGALITEYLKSAGFRGLRDTSKTGYMSRLNTMREAHGHRAVVGLTRERINTIILQPYADYPAAALDTLKKLRILINHAVQIGWLKTDPSLGIKRPKTKEIRAWTDRELDAFRRRWPLGTKQRTAFALMLNVGAARVDVHHMTWAQIDVDGIDYQRRKTGVAVAIGMADDLRAALGHAARDHVTIINTEFGKPFTIDGFSGFMRDAITSAGLPLECRPHGLRKTLGRMLADAGVSAHDIMAILGHTTLQQAENYTREANKRAGGKRGITQLNDHMANRVTQTASNRLGKIAKTGEGSEG